MLTSGFSYSTGNILESRIGTNPSRSILYNNRKITNSDVINEIIKKIDFHPKDSKKIPHRYTRGAVSYTHLRAHETDSYLVCRLLLEKKKKTKT